MQLVHYAEAKYHLIQHILVLFMNVTNNVLLPDLSYKHQ